MIIDAFFEGGGILGISFIGAYKALSERGIRIEKAAGISSGAIIAALIIAGFSANDLIEIMNLYDFSFFRRKTEIAKRNYIGKPLSLLYEKGIYESKVIEEFMNELLMKKNIVSFKDVMFQGESRLKIIATDFSNKRMLLLPDDLKEMYKLDPYYFSIPKAVQMSCAIPFFYTPVELWTNNKVNYIVDGGMIRNIPTSIINKDGKLKNLTVRFKIKEKEHVIKQFFDFRGNRIDKENKLKEKTIIIHNDSNIRSTDFNIDKDKIIYLYKLGYKAALEFIRDI